MPPIDPISEPLLDETTTPLIQRTIRHAKIIGNFASVQVLVRCIGFASGILLVRYLNQNEYAYFTIANTMQGTIYVLAVIVTPILYWMLLRNGASPMYCAGLIGAVLFGLVIQLSVGVLGVVPRLRSEVSQIQKSDLTGAIARLLALVGLAFLFLNAGVAVLVGSGAMLLQYWLLRRYVASVVDLSAPENREDRSAMVGFIKSQAANAIFFCVQGQITISSSAFSAVAPRRSRKWGRWDGWR